MHALLMPGILSHTLQSHAGTPATPTGVYTVSDKGDCVQLTAQL